MRFTIGDDQLRYWSSAAHQWVVEPEAFDVWVGTDSNATAHGEFQVVK